MLGTTQIQIRYNIFGKYVNWFSLLVRVQMLEYIYVYFVLMLIILIRCWTIEVLDNCYGT